MSRLFFDTSALIKLYHQEEGTDVVDELLLQDQPVIVVISDLTLIEMVSAFAKKVRTQAITKVAFTMVVTAFEKDVRVFELIAIDQNVKSSAIQLLKIHGLERGLRTLDALQLASALTANRRMPLDLFVAADKTLHAVAKQESLPVLLV